MCSQVNVFLMSVILMHRQIGSCAPVTEDCYTGTGLREFIHVQSVAVCLDVPQPWNPNLYQIIGNSYVTALAPS